ncbi:MAG: HEAT repeat domain-containing protein [Acidobacteriota bacterium]|nr:HEAT repeat domain-containing protein [Acidobacteriota bacterium]
MIRTSILFAVMAAGAWAQNWPAASAFSFDSQEAVRDDADYQRGLSELDSGQWEQAIRSFATSAARGRANADGAVYWTAYAQSRAGRAQGALRTIAHLREKYPASRWLKDARALELEVRAQTGSPVSPNSEPDEGLKLMAVNSLMTSDPSVALPVVEKVLTSGHSDEVKEQALFVLSQNSSPEADKLLGNIASGKSNPALQVKAIRVMGMMGDEASRKSLTALYGLSTDTRVKRAILQSFMQSGSRDFLLHAAKTELDPQLRRDAIRQLAFSGGGEQLWQLYQNESSIEDKKAILESMFLTSNSSKLADVARADSHPELRVAAIRSLGLMGHDGSTGQMLSSIYERDKDVSVREAALNALIFQQNGKELIELAKREKDPQMKKAIVSRMAMVPSKEVTDYMIEILR